MLTKLDNDKKKTIVEYCYERFGIIEATFNGYKWYIGSKNRIYIGPEKIKRIDPESIGLCIFRLDKSPKPTTNFIQLFSNKISKNIVNLNKKNTINFCGGMDLKLNTDLDPGFVTVMYNEIALGCGHWNGQLLKNQIPKSKFCEIKFL